MSLQIAFPDGLVGLPTLVRFSLSPVAGTALLEFVSLDDPSFALVATPADEVQPGMHATLEARGLASDDADVFVLLAVHGEPPQVTANLAGPIVVSAGVGRQLVLEDPAFPLRAPVGGTD